MIKSNQFTSADLMDVVKRMEAIIELVLNSGEQVVGTAIVPTTNGFMGVVFHARELPPPPSPIPVFPNANQMLVKH